MREMISGRVKGYVSRIIMAEFFYKVCQKFGKDVALVRLALIRRTGISEEEMPHQEVINVGLLKLKYPRLSLADCIIANLAIGRRAKLLTTEDELAGVAGLKVEKLEF